MKIDLADSRVDQAVRLIKETHTPANSAELERIFEEQYHCKIYPDVNNPWATTGYMEISEEKYHTWFILKFGDNS